MKRHHIVNYNSINLKRMAKQVCKKKVSKMKTKKRAKKMIRIPLRKSKKEKTKNQNLLVSLR